jgi:hypothetical protein
MPDLSSLSRQELHDLRLELTNALLNPGIEFDIVGHQGKADEQLYKDTIVQIKSILGDD